MCPPPPTSASHSEDPEETIESKKSVRVATSTYARALAANLVRRWLLKPLNMLCRGRRTAPPGPLPVPLNTMSAPRRNTRACLECSGQKVKCEYAPGSTACMRCHKRELLCEPRRPSPKQPCERCKRSHLGCDQPEEGEGPCAHCVRSNVRCSFAPDATAHTPTSESALPPGSTSPTETSPSHPSLSPPPPAPPPSTASPTTSSDSPEPAPATLPRPKRKWIETVL
ncbi:hypothetical protein BC628DRAFT_1352245 [Trametes gibbosa]|uniref:Zn(2)-Cys(6)22 n=1 Tax=Trametes gibbosa TaxID=160864 RepID=A0A976XIF3_9APHY|nr:hypothetical protein BC628DRAFT_1352245 [Trametes gibbosa]UVB64068.1 Zn(2)-Cys(6)22 [Trametes gibbosa]